MNLNVDITASLNKKQLEELIIKQIEQEWPQYRVVSISFVISPGYSDYRESSPASLTSVNVKLAAKA